MNNEKVDLFEFMKNNNLKFYIEKNKITKNIIINFINYKIEKDGFLTEENGESECLYGAISFYADKISNKKIVFKYYKNKKIKKEINVPNLEVKIRVNMNYIIDNFTAFIDEEIKNMYYDNDNQYFNMPYLPDHNFLEEKVKIKNDNPSEEIMVLKYLVDNIDKAYNANRELSNFIWWFAKRLKQISE